MQRRPPPPRAPLAWDDVRLFLALSRARTLGAAAAALGVDASTMSRRLSALEEALATTLFDRGRDGIRPTKAAEDLRPAAEEIEEAMLRFAAATDGLEREVAGWVRMTCPPDAAEVLVVPLLGELLAAHPKLRVELDPGEAVRDLARREADLALRTVRPRSGDLIVVRLGAVRWIAAAAPALARQLGPLRAWTEAPWVGWGERLAHVAPARWLAAHLRDDEPAVRSDSFRVQLAAIAEGLGVGLVPAPTARHFGLVPVATSARLRKEREDWPTDELFLVTHRALREVPRVRVLWELLLARASEWNEPGPRAR
ncbi:LysR family transcriptional regulator [Nannocystis punicea]|uniref:LysR family transcriptional regulator n=1 Tax=Nannocystis punicea TaxID=2995304 RepID=A0ABY7H8B4_9BACT|nr:LysR family transcriptional regulator [Nannocystis poenicansa]WAS95330.1 LysR family transcriptional regulator [Nannocystis poenicansa]